MSLMEISNDLFVSPAVEKRTVKLPDGSEHEFYFRKVSSYENSRFVTHVHSKIADERADAPNIMVAASVCDAAGKPILSIEKARLLKGEVLDQMFGFAIEVNRREKAEGNG